MSFSMSSQKFIDGVLVAPGAVFSFDPGHSLRFSISTVCESVNPETWQGRVTLEGQTIISTDRQPSREGAGALAKRTLTQRLVALLGDQSD